jgi:hypothetical protein
MCEQGSLEIQDPRETDCGGLGSAETLSFSAKANVDIPALELMDVRTPRGRRGRHVRTEWTAKARNRSRVAWALPHSEDIAYSRRAVKSRCACERGGWGRLSDDGPGHYNPDPSEGPLGWWRTHLMAVHHRVHGPTQSGTIVATTGVHEGRT